uniref:Prospero domain-containing protein n=1 Tax=Monopterus albus TaxID=43700 RepID=A0A3Q3IK10_MONAL|nr:prospero homeobox protein 1-like [Monopterus albus]
MNPSLWGKGMFTSSNICLEDCPAEQLSHFQPDPAPPDVSNVSVTLHSDNENMKMLPESAYYSSSEAGSSLIFSSKLELNPRYSSCDHHVWNVNSGHQAKRARVENIIKGMTGSPGMYCLKVTTNQHEETDCVQEKERIQELPSHQENTERSGSGATSHSQTKKKQHENQHQRLRTRFKNVVTEPTDSSKEENYPMCSGSPDNSPRDSYSRFESSSNTKYQGWKKVKLMNYFQSRPDRIKLMADVLKYELSRAVSRSVDSIFKSMPLLQTSPNDNSGTVETDVSLKSSVCKDNKLRLACYENAEVQVPDVQTEALSLVVQKPQLESSDNFVLQSRLRAHHHPKPPLDSTVHEDQPPEKNHNAVHQHALRCLQDEPSEAAQAKLETFDTYWNSVKVRSKVNSRSMKSPQTHPVSVDPTLLESLCLPHVKIESDSLVRNKLYMLNEGLTTNHLKKAKLMFFYTRYPSSLVLKMCFHDVQFTRCITSQLIKWFSNFREFYYIQMEKFARHALMEGVADVRVLTVGRQSELFRALNMHYNKANDFQVPDRFLEVAEITLREFYIALSMGKDRDPSWKKAIYKVICKLDSDVPTEFKTHSE